MDRGEPGYCLGLWPGQWLELGPGQWLGLVVARARAVARVKARAVLISGPQPFLRHGLVSCETIFSWTGLQGVGDKYDEIK